MMDIAVYFKLYFGMIFALIVLWLISSISIDFYRIRR